MFATALGRSTVLFVHFRSRTWCSSDLFSRGLSAPVGFDLSNWHADGAFGQRIAAGRALFRNRQSTEPYLDDCSRANFLQMSCLSDTGYEVEGCAFVVPLAFRIEANPRPRVFAIS